MIEWIAIICATLFVIAAVCFSLWEATISIATEMDNTEEYDEPGVQLHD